MAEFNDLTWENHGGEEGAGWESIYIFENHYQIQVKCGPSVFTPDVTDFDLRSSASDYSTFEWKTYDGVTILDDTNWQGGKTKEDITAEMARLAALESVVDPEPGE